MNLLIEVFVRSYSQYVDVSFYREMSQHPICAPDLATWASEAPSRFKGRLFSQQDLTALEQVSQVAKKTNEKIKVYDVSRLTDKVTAMKRRIRKTPTVIIDGEKHEGLEEIRRATSEQSS